MADSGEINADISKKRKRVTRNCRKNKTLEESYLVEVEQLARIKQKQEEDKSAARLHSFNGGSGPVVCATTSSEKKERMSCFKSIGSSTKAQELLVLGGQPLTEMKDKIHCLTDEIMEKSGQHDASGSFLIEDVFCNDLREASATDYSKTHT